MVDVSREPRQERSRRSSSRILAAARAVLAERGLDGFSVQEVAERAEVSVGNVYRRYTGRDQLLACVREEVLAELAADTRANLATLRGADLDTVLRTFVHSVSVGLSRPERLFSAVMARPAATEPERAGALARIHALYAAFHEAATASGEVVADDAVVATVHELLLGLLTRRLRGEYAFAETVSWDEMEEGAIALALRCLKIPSA